MFDFEEIEEVAPAAKDAAAAAKLGAQQPPASGAPAVKSRTDPVVVPLAGEGRSARGEAHDEAVRSFDDAAFEEAEAAKRQWLAAGDRSMALRAAVGRAREAVAAVEEAVRDAWYDCQPDEAIRHKSRMADLALELDEAKEDLERAEQAEEDCAQAARAAQKKASEIRKAREAEVDRWVCDRIHAATANVIVPFSPWLPFGAMVGAARVRLFAFLGVGREAREYQQWQEVAKRAYPSITVCLVQIPRETHLAARGNAHTLAEAFIKEALDPILSDGRPFALLGCCSGARLAYEVARRRSPARLYVAGRAAPHCGARGEPREEVCDPVPPSEAGEPVSARLCAADQGWGSAVQNDPRALLDLEIGWTPLERTDATGRALAVRPFCRTHLYEAGRDAVWPPSVIRHGWNLYAPAAGGRCPKKTYKGLSHEELCSPSGAPLLVDVLLDLRSLLEAPRPP